MGNAQGLYRMAAKGAGGFGGGGGKCVWTPVVPFEVHEDARPRLCFGPASDSILDDGGTFKNLEDEISAAMALLSRGTAGTRGRDIGALAAGTEVEFRIKSRAGGSGDASRDLTVGVAKRETLLVGNVWERMWGYSASGSFWTQGSRSTGKKAFSTGDLIRLKYDGDSIKLFLNGSSQGQITGVSGEVFPVVCLVKKDEAVRVRLVGRAPTVLPVADFAWDPESQPAALSNPLHTLFLERELRKWMAPPDGEDGGAESDQECLQPFMLEKHLWGPGLANADMKREATKLAAAAHRRLCQHADAHDMIRVVADARMAQLGRLAKGVMRSARGANGSTNTLEPRQRTEWHSPTVSSEGEDMDGLFHWLGTKGGVDEHSSPIDSGRVDVKAMPSKYSRGNPKDILDGSRKQLNMSADETDDAYIQIELKDVALVPSAYKIRTGGSTNAAHLTSWKLEASLDGDRWQTLSRHVQEMVFQTDWQVMTWDLSAELAFRFFRLKMDGRNTKNTRQLAVSNLELYGKVYTSATEDAVALERMQDSAPARMGRNLFGGTFDIFLMMLQEQMRTSSSAFSVMALQKVQQTLASVEPGALASTSAQRPLQVTDDQLDSLSQFLCGVVETGDTAIAQLAASCYMVLSTRRGRLRDLCQVMRSLDTVAAGSQQWAEDTSASLLKNVIASACEYLELPDIGVELLGRIIAKAVPLGSTGTADTIDRSEFGGQLAWLLDPCVEVLEWFAQKICFFASTDFMHSVTSTAAAGDETAMVKGVHDLVSILMHMQVRSISKLLGNESASEFDPYRKIASKLAEDARKCYDASHAAPYCKIAEDLVRCTTSLLYRVSTDQKELVISSVTGDLSTSPSAPIVAQALLSSLSSVADALSLLGTHASGSGSIKNLDDTAGCLGVLRVFFELSSNSSSLQTPGAGSGIVTALAKMQAGVWAKHKTSATPQSQDLLCAYTKLICESCGRAVDAAIGHSDGKADDADMEAFSCLGQGIVGGLMPTWAVVLGTVEWNIFSSATVEAILELISKLRRANAKRFASLTKFSSDDKSIEWSADLELSLGHYAVSQLLRLGTPDAQAPPSELASEQARLTKNGRHSATAAEGVPVGLDFLSAQSMPSMLCSFVRACAEQAGLEPPADDEDGRAVVATFSALLYHAGLAKSAETCAQRNEKVPQSIIGALEAATDSIISERTLSVDINLSRQRSTSRFVGIAERAQFLLEFNPLVEMVAEDKGVDGEPEAAGVPEDAGGALTKTNSRLAKEALELNSRSMANVPLDLRGTFLDVKGFVKNDSIDLNLLKEGATKSEDMAKQRVMALNHVAALVAVADSLQPGFVASQLKRHAAKLVLQDNDPDIESHPHYLSLYAGCGPSLEKALTEAYKNLVCTCVSSIPIDASFSHVAPLFACVWEPSDADLLLQSSLHERLTARRRCLINEEAEPAETVELAASATFSCVTAELAGSRVENMSGAELIIQADGVTADRVRFAVTLTNDDKKVIIVEYDKTKDLTGIVECGVIQEEVQAGDDDAELMPGIIQIDGRKLSIAYTTKGPGADRPTEFKSGKDTMFLILSPSLSRQQKQQKSARIEENLLLDVLQHIMVMTVVQGEAESESHKLLGQNILDTVVIDIEASVASALPFFATLLPAHEASVTGQIFGEKGMIAKSISLLASKVISEVNADHDSVLTRPPFDELEFLYCEAMEQFTVPTSGHYRIICVGAKGGDGDSKRGGKGATVSASFALIEGDCLDILVGGMSVAVSSQSGGGGGTFVSINGKLNPLIVAGGGGGTRGGGNDSDGADAGLSEDGTDGSGSNSARGGRAGMGGASAASSYGNGGAGFFANGESENSCSPGPGNSFQNGGTCTYGRSGFGGGAGHGSSGGGGGGGYSGGGGGQGGGGGGSFVRFDGIDIAKENMNDGHGSLKIVWERGVEEAKTDFGGMEKSVLLLVRRLLSIATPAVADEALDGICPVDQRARLGKLQTTGMVALHALSKIAIAGPETCRNLAAQILLELPFRPEWKPPVLAFVDLHLQSAWWIEDNPSASSHEMQILAVKLCGGLPPTIVHGGLVSTNTGDRKRVLKAAVGSLDTLSLLDAAGKTVVDQNVKDVAPVARFAVDMGMLPHVLNIVHQCQSAPDAASDDWRQSELRAFALRALGELTQTFGSAVVAEVGASGLFVPLMSLAADFDSAKCIDTEIQTLEESAAALSAKVAREPLTLEPPSEPEAEGPEPESAPEPEVEGEPEPPKAARAGEPGWADSAGYQIASLLQIGMRCEALNRKSPELICVGSIQDIKYDTCQVLIHLDGMTDKYEYWTRADSADIRNAGWCNDNAQVLQAPKGYRKGNDSFTWAEYLAEVGAKCVTKEMLEGKSTEDTADVHDAAMRGMLEDWKSKGFCIIKSEDRGHWKTIALAGGSQDSVKAEDSKEVDRNTIHKDMAKIEMADAAAELKRLYWRLSTAYGLRTFLQMLENLPAESKHLISPNSEGVYREVDLLSSLLSKANRVGVEASSIKRIILRFIELSFDAYNVLSSDALYFVSKALESLSFVSTLKQISNESEHSAQVAIATLSCLAADQSLLHAAKASLMTEQSIAMLVFAACSTTGKLRRELAGLVGSLVAGGGFLCPERSLDPKLTAGLVCLFEDEYSSAIASGDAGFGTSNLHSVANTLVQWQTIPAKCFVTAPWTQVQLTLLEGLSTLMQSMLDQRVESVMKVGPKIPSSSNRENGHCTVQAAEHSGVLTDVAFRIGAKSTPLDWEVRVYDVGSGLEGILISKETVKVDMAILNKIQTVALSGKQRVRSGQHVALASTAALKISYESDDKGEYLYTSKKHNNEIGEPVKFERFKGYTGWTVTVENPDIMDVPARFSDCAKTLKHALEMRSDTTPYVVATESPGHGIRSFGTCMNLCGFKTVEEPEPDPEPEPAPEPEAEPEPESVDDQLQSVTERDAVTTAALAEAKAELARLKAMESEPPPSGGGSGGGGGGGSGGGSEAEPVRRLPPVFLGGPRRASVSEEPESDADSSSDDSSIDSRTRESLAEASSAEDAELMPTSSALLELSARVHEDTVAADAASALRGNAFMFDRGHSQFVAELLDTLEQSIENPNSVVGTSDQARSDAAKLAFARFRLLHKAASEIGSGLPQALCLERDVKVASGGRSAVASKGEETFECTQEVEKYMVPSSGEYRITAKGAKGGDGSDHTGGTGAVIAATFALEEGDRLDILVGGMSTRHGNQTGGGGGTFVSINGLRNPLIVAGGGGGTRGQSGDADGTDASLTEDGEDGRGSNHAAGGTAGHGGESATGSYGNGGGGYFTGGNSEFSHAAGPGNGFVDGGECTYEESGFGGGGGYGSDGGGGGGGYSGGGGGQGGGGGGSHVRVDGMQVSKEVGNESHGEVTIELLSTASIPGLSGGRYVPDGVKAVPDGRGLTVITSDFTLNEDGIIAGSLSWTRARDGDGSEAAAEVATEVLRGKFSGPPDCVMTLEGVETKPAEAAASWCPLGKYSIVCDPTAHSIAITIEGGGSGGPTELPMQRQQILTWDQYIESVFGFGGTGSESEIPAGFKLIDDNGDWSNADDVQLAGFLCSIDGRLEEEHVTPDALVKYPRLCNREPPHILCRAQIITRLSSTMLDVIPLVDFESQDALLPGAAAILKLRTLILKHHKTPVVAKVLKALKSSDISRPSISIDRTKARWGDKDLGGEHSIFAQIYYALGEHAHAKTLFRGAERWWTVSFVNEHVSDAGGGFRETVSNISDDLNSERTPLLIPVPNSKAEVGDMRDAWMPSPSCRDMRKYEFLGRLMAAAIQCDENIVVKFPPFVWKKIAHFPVGLDEYKKSIDAFLSSYEAMLSLDEETFEFSFDEVFEAPMSDGVLRELVPGGAAIEVTFANRAEFVDKIIAARLAEIDEQCEAIRRGLLSACIPAPVLGLWTVDEFRSRVCGSPTIDLEALKKSTTFSGTGDKDMFWAVMADFTDEDRSLLLKFTSGRLRLPVRLQVSWSSARDDKYPTAATCSNALYLPRYSTAEIMAERLRYACTNCMSIDTDG